MSIVDVIVVTCALLTVSAVFIKIESEKLRKERNNYRDENIKMKAELNKKNIKLDCLKPKTKNDKISK